MIEILSIYMPMDRRQALARGEILPDRATGAALVADVSGFTPFTEMLAQALGAQRGAEEVTRTLNRVLDALIGEVDHYGGSVISFNGDGITCWFSDDNGQRATACALAMQTVLQARAAEGPAGVALAMKVAVATGAARRFVVGDPAAGLIDVLAGSLLDRLAIAEHLAAPGEVILDSATVQNLGDLLQGIEWRVPEHAVVRGLADRVPPRPWPPLARDALTMEQVRPWVLPAIYERLRHGAEEFLAELRPAVSLFLHFAGIDYDTDPAAGTKLDALVHWAQEVLARYGGTLIHLTLGDKGSYFYAVFGAPVAHGDDPDRAARAALELQRPPRSRDGLGDLLPVRIGISGGRGYAGIYGGATHRTYSLLGDAVNVAARLMEHAPAGHILVSGVVHQAIVAPFAWEALPTLRVKGKVEPIPVFRLLGAGAPRLVRLPDGQYALPVVGRAAELTCIEEKLALAQRGQGQIVAITGEAGLGKSRLVAELIQRATTRGFISYSGECQSYGTYTPYLVWAPIWRAFFDLDAAANADEQVEALETTLARIAPAVLPRLPLLSVVLGLPIPPNDLTRTFDAGLRKASLEALLVDCLRARLAGPSTPLLLVLEDAHWLDPLSQDLLEAVGRAIVQLPVLITVAYRPTERGSPEEPGISRLPHCTEIGLTDFTPQEAAQLMALKLDRLGGSFARMSPALIEQIIDRAEGNPLYIEELLNYLYDRGLDLRDTVALEQIDLPTSLHSLILDRVDRLPENQQITLKVASIIGRLFLVAWLWGVYPTLGTLDHVTTALDALQRLELTRLDTPEPDLAYIFKHQATWEVAYESLTYAVRARFHERLAQWLEQTYSSAAAPPVTLLAYHYGRSENVAKQREYYRKAGDAAAAVYANAAAIDVYTRLLPLLAPAEQVEILLKLGQVLERVGQWTAAEARYQEALEHAEKVADEVARVRARQALGVVRISRGAHTEALASLEQARIEFIAGGNVAWARAGLGRVLVEIGELQRRQGNYTQARQALQESLALAQEQEDLAGIARAFHDLGWLSYSQGDYATARILYEQGLELRRTSGDKQGLAHSLSSLGAATLAQGDLVRAQALLAESLVLRREMGDKQGIARSLNILGLVAQAQGDYTQAQKLFEESQALGQELGDKQALTVALHNLGWVVYAQGNYGAAQAALESALALAREVGSRWSTALTLCYLGWVADQEHDPGLAVRLLQESLTLCQAYEIKYPIILCLIQLAHLSSQAGQGDRAARLLGAADGLRAVLNVALTPAENLVYARTLEQICAQLGESDADSLVAAGRALTWEQAVVYSLAAHSSVEST